MALNVSDNTTQKELKKSLDEAKDNEKGFNKIILRLSETETVWLLSLNSLYSQDDAIDVEKVLNENNIYQAKKNRIEWIRKRCMADAQFSGFLEKSLGTSMAPAGKKDASVFASEWDLFDTYSAFDEEKLASSAKYLVLDDEKKSVESSCALSAEEQAKEIFKSFNFKYSSLVSERLLASNSYQDEQYTFKTKFVSRYDPEPSTFTYDLKALWSFKKNFEQRLSVTALDWNPLNQDLLAVGYGNLNFLKNTFGSVCIWSPKNPRQPEREFYLKESVTAIHYSRLRPNFLAVGTRKGKVYVLDVSSYDGKVRFLMSDEAKPRPYPIWKVEWFFYKELFFEKEKLLVVGESGIVTLFSFPSAEVALDVLKLDYVVSREQFLEKKSFGKTVMWHQTEELIYDKKTFSGLCFSIFADRNYCYVATKEGVLVKCNLRNPSMATDIFKAHDGPVCVVEHSPATDLVYLTCGADWNIKIWLKGIDRPLITLMTEAPVTCAKWCPTIPTIIASIGDVKLSLWDISRNIILPMSTKNFEDCKKPFSSVLFSSNGSNIIIGGQDGEVRTVHLSQLPRIPFFQKEALINAIKNGLNRNKSMIDVFTRALEQHKTEIKALNHI